MCNEAGYRRNLRCEHRRTPRTHSVQISGGCGTKIALVVERRALHAEEPHWQRMISPSNLPAYAFAATMRNAQQSAVALDMIALMDRLKIQKVRCQGLNLRTQIA